MEPAGITTFGPWWRTAQPAQARQVCESGGNMKTLSRVLLCAGLLAALVIASARWLAADAPVQAGRTIAAFTLHDVAGKPVALADFKDAKAVVVVFLGTQ